MVTMIKRIVVHALLAIVMLAPILCAPVMQGN